MPEDTLLASQQLDVIRRDVAQRQAEQLTAGRIRVPVASFMGYGTILYGAKRKDDLTNSYVSTLWLTMLFIPFVPLGAYRVAYTSHRDVPGLGFSSKFVVLGRLPLSRKSLAVPLVWAVLFLFSLAGNR